MHPDRKYGRMNVRVPTTVRAPALHELSRRSDTSIIIYPEVLITHNPPHHHTPAFALPQTTGMSRDPEGPPHVPWPVRARTSYLHLLGIVLRLGSTQRANQTKPTQKREIVLRLAAVRGRGGARNRRA